MAADLPQRLAKRVVALTQCSRREAEQYIEGGWVRVDGEVVDRPQAMVTSQIISVDSAATLTRPEPATLLLHKPARLGNEAALALMTAESHSAVDASGERVLARHFVRQQPLLALPDMASGLVAFSLDARVQGRLAREGDRIEQELLVEVTGAPIENALALLNHGLSFNGYAMPPLRVSWQSEQRLRFAIRRLQPSLIPRMCAAVGLEAVSMKRLRIGRLGLARMEVGQWRYAAPSERF